MRSCRTRRTRLEKRTLFAAPRHIEGNRALGSRGECVYTQRITVLKDREKSNFLQNCTISQSFVRNQRNADCEKCAIMQLIVVLREEWQSKRPNGQFWKLLRADVFHKMKNQNCTTSQTFVRNQDNGNCECANMQRIMIFRDGSGPDRQKADVAGLIQHR